MPQYLVTDESLEAAAALEMVAETLVGVGSDPYRWKWATIALHSALQGFMVLALRGTSGFDALSARAAAEYVRAHDAGAPAPGEELDTYLGLYKKIKSDRMLMWGTSVKFVPTGSQGASVKMLNRLRNKFVHFLPQGFLLEVTGLPQLFADCLDVIEFLGWSSGNVIWHVKEFEARADVALASARETVRTLEA